jgi:crossover junction endodeoxyribonuclease RusA
MSLPPIEIPPGVWISANDRRHWADLARATRALRLLGAKHAHTNGLRDLGTTHVAAFIGYPRGGRADPSNAAPTVKALVDGLTDAGCWPDDDHTNVIGPTFLRDPATGKKGVHTVRFVLTAQGIPWGAA